MTYKVIIRLEDKTSLTSIAHLTSSGKQATIHIRVFFASMIRC